MEPVKLGNLIEGEAFKDAIHIAICPVIAAEKLHPGEFVGFVNGSTEEVTSSARTLIGIIDPWLRGVVRPKQRFFMLIHPNTITSLRHEWTHPAFATALQASDKAAVARKVIETMAEACGLSYGALMDYAEYSLDSGDVTVQQGSETWRDNFNREVFWPAYEMVTGKKVENHEQGVFCCTC